MDLSSNILPQIQVIIFDCDGVLFDSRRSNRIFYDHLGDYLGRPAMTEADLSYVHMHTVTEAIDYLFSDEAHRKSAHAYRGTLDFTPFIGMMDMEPGLIDFLTQIRPGIKTAIATNRTTTIHQVLSMFHLDTFFDLVVSALDVSRPKPDPESVIKILEHFDAAPEKCLYIGDSEVDAQTAFLAGVPFVAFKNDELTADLHVGGFPELMEFVQKRSASADTFHP